MTLRQFTIRDIAFLAVMAALLFLCSAVAMPLMAVNIFGLRNMTIAILYGVFGTLALMKVRKPGALSLLGLFNAAILLMMSPVMFATTTASALLAEAVTLLLFKSYDSDKAVYAAACLMIPLSLPFTALFTVVMNGVPWREVFAPLWLTALTCAGTVILSAAGGWIGGKIGKELKKAGKL